MTNRQRRWRGRARPSGLGSWLACLLALGLLAAACGTVTPTAGVQTSPLAANSPLPSATAAPILPPTSTAAPLPAPATLVVLHTNDNWGETEPCG
jgi:hypothetical protein